MFLERNSASAIEYIHKCKILTEAEAVYFKAIILLNLFFIFYSWYDLNELTGVGSECTYFKCFDSVIFFINFLKN